MCLSVCVRARVCASGSPKHICAFNHVHPDVRPSDAEAQTAPGCRRLPHRQTDKLVNIRSVETIPTVAIGLFKGGGGVGVGVGGLSKSEGRKGASRGRVKEVGRGMKNSRQARGLGCAGGGVGKWPKMGKLQVMKDRESS